MKEKSAIWDAVRPCDNSEKSTHVCVCCDLEYSATATRIEEHLTGGSKGIRACPHPERAPERVSVFIASRSCARSGAKRSRAEGSSQSTVAQLFGNDRTRAADLAISEFIYGCGLPPSVARTKCPAWKWWQLYGSLYPDLQRVAVRVTAQVVSATACERAWSAFGYVHTASRNRMAAAKAADMTTVYWNLRLRDQLSESNEHQYFAWDELLGDDSDN